MNLQNDVPSVNYGGHEDKQNKRKLRNDLILIGALLLLLLTVWLCVLLFREEGDVVIVRVAGEEYGRYSLTRDAEVEIRTGERGEELNRLVIREGKAMVTEATCPDGICAAHKPISHDGESIACKPHRVVIVVDEAEE